MFAAKEEGVLLKPFFQASALSFEQQKEMLLLQLEHDRVRYERDQEHEKIKWEHNRVKYEHDREHDRMKCELGIEKEITVERIRQESEKAKLEMEEHRLSILRDGRAGKLFKWILVA